MTSVQEKITSQATGTVQQSAVSDMKMEFAKGNNIRYYLTTIVAMNVINALPEDSF